MDAGFAATKPLSSREAKFVMAPISSSPLLCSALLYSAPTFPLLLVHAVVAGISEPARPRILLLLALGLPVSSTSMYQDLLSYHPRNAELAWLSSVIHFLSSTRLWSPGYNKPLMAAISLHPCPRHAHRNRHQHPCADTFRGGVKGNKQHTWRRHQLQGQPPMMPPPAPFVACDQCHVG